MQHRNNVRLTVALVIVGTAIAFPFAVNWYWHFYWHEADSKMQAILPAPPDCYVPPGVMVDGAARATVQAWDDRNGDGLRSADEPPLQGVIVITTRAGHPYSAKEAPISWGQVTDKDGRASLYEFRAGCACRCWEDVAVAAWGPARYQATTPTLVAMSKDDQAVSFGFKQVSP